MTNDQVYRVFDPRINQYLQGQWKRIEDIPEQVPDRFYNHVHISNLRIHLYDLKKKTKVEVK